MFDDLNSLSVPTPPAKGFRLFGHSGPPLMNACLNYTHNMGDAYTEGYRRAAERLIEHVGDTNREHDFLVYPVMFLYRQHLELLLKEILALLFSLGIRTSNFPPHHRLLDLWNECQPELQKLSGGEEREWFEAVTECLKQFVDVDPYADAFRYPKRRDGTTSLATVKHINLGHLKLVMSDIADWLSGATMFLSTLLENMPRDEGY